MAQKILVNLSFFSPDNQTGISRYASGILKGFNQEKYKILGTPKTREYIDPENLFEFKKTPKNITFSHGRSGHFRRLIWTQLGLQEIAKESPGSLVFSPLPEGYLFSPSRQIIVIHDLIPLRFPSWRSPLLPYHKFYVPEVARQAEHLICNSEATAKDLVRFCGVSAKKISPILLGYDHTHFQPFRDNNFSTKTPYFLYVGRHDLHKNIARIIHSFKAAQFSEETRLLLVGSDHPRHTPLLRQQIAELGLTNRVKFLDYVPYKDLPKIISGAIALVFPSLWEGFGLPILEAMGCGTPVITSNLASMPEVAGDAAILVDPYNTAEITDAMRAIAEDAQLRTKLSELGLARAKQFSWEKTAKQTEEVLLSFL